MNVADIKFRKERISDYTVRHWFDAGTNHLGPVYATKHYRYDVYNADGECLTYRNCNLRTLRDVKEWIAGYDEREDRRLAELKAESERYDRMMEERRERENALIEDFIKPTDVKTEYTVGDMIKVEIGKISKPGTMGEALDCLEDSYDAKVAHIATVTPEEFDAAAKDLYSDFKADWLKESDESGTVGGYVSDHPDLEGLSWNEIMGDPDNKKLWYSTNYMIATLIIAPGRVPMVIDTSGYRYARYAGKIA